MNSSHCNALAIPAEWASAAALFADMRRKTQITDAEWEAIADWLATTVFDDRNYLAGDVAAALFRDRATEARREELVGRLGHSPQHEQFRAILRNEPATAVGRAVSAKAGV